MSKRKISTDVSNKNQVRQNQDLKGTKFFSLFEKSRTKIKVHSSLVSSESHDNLEPILVNNSPDNDGDKNTIIILDEDNSHLVSATHTSHAAAVSFFKSKFEKKAQKVSSNELISLLDMSEPENCDESSQNISKQSSDESSLVSRGTKQISKAAEFFMTNEEKKKLKINENTILFQIEKEKSRYISKTFFSGVLPTRDIFQKKCQYENFFGDICKGVEDSLSLSYIQHINPPRVIEQHTRTLSCDLQFHGIVSMSEFHLTRQQSDCYTPRSTLELRTLWAEFFCHKYDRSHQLNSIDLTDQYIECSFSSYRLLTEVIKQTIAQESENLSLQRIWHWFSQWNCNIDRKQELKLTIDDAEWSDEENLQEEKSTGVLVILGPSGTGKTSLVHEFAKKFGYKVIEMNASQLRNSVQITKLIAEASQSQRVDICDSVSLTKDDVCIDKNCDPKLDVSVILFDEADVVFDEDKNFHASLLQLASNSKSPIVITAESLSDKFLLQFHHPTVVEVQPVDRDCVMGILLAVIKLGCCLKVFNPDNLLYHIMPVVTEIHSSQDLDYIKADLTSLSQLVNNDIRSCVCDLDLNLISVKRREFVSLDRALTFQEWLAKTKYIGSILDRMQYRSGIASTNITLPVIMERPHIFSIVPNVIDLCENFPLLISFHGINFLHPSHPLHLIGEMKELAKVTIFIEDKSFLAIVMSDKNLFVRFTKEDLCMFSGKSESFTVSVCIAVNLLFHSNINGIESMTQLSLFSNTLTLTFMTCGITCSNKILNSRSNNIATFKRTELSSSDDDFEEESHCTHVSKKRVILSDDDDDDYGDNGDSDISNAKERILNPINLTRHERKFIMQLVLAKLQQNPLSEPFLEPVDRCKRLDYGTVIKTPIDLSTIFTFVEENRYNDFKDTKAFDSDIHKIFENCCKYNSPNSEIVKMSAKLKKYYDDECRSILNIVSFKEIDFQQCRTMIPSLEEQRNSRVEKSVCSSDCLDDVFLLTQYLDSQSKLDTLQHTVDIRTSCFDRIRDDYVRVERNTSLCDLNFECNYNELCECDCFFYQTNLDILRSIQNRYESRIIQKVLLTQTSIQLKHSLYHLHNEVRGIHVVARIFKDVSPMSVLHKPCHRSSDTKLRYSGKFTLDLRPFLVHMIRSETEACSTEAIKNKREQDMNDTAPGVPALSKRTTRSSSLKRDDLIQKYPHVSKFFPLHDDEIEAMLQCHISWTVPS